MGTFQWCEPAPKSIPWADSPVCPVLPCLQVGKGTTQEGGAMLTKLNCDNNLLTTTTPFNSPHPRQGGLKPAASKALSELLQ
jgi:hypothetical protein